MGTGPRQVPEPGRSEKTTVYSREQSEKCSCEGKQSRCPRLLYHFVSFVNRVAGRGNRRAKLRRFYRKTQSAVCHCPQGKGQPQTLRKVWHVTGPALSAVHCLERKGWGINRTAGLFVFIKQYRQAHDQAGHSEGFQKSCATGRIAGALFNPLLQAYLCLRALPCKRLQPAAGSEATWPLQQPDHRSLRGYIPPGYGEVTGKALQVKRCYYAILLILAFLFFAAQLNAANIELPKQWYDIEKDSEPEWCFNDDGDMWWQADEEYGLTPDLSWGGCYWPSRLVRSTRQCYDDSNDNGCHDPGEPAAEYPSSTWINPIQTSDNSCWMASAANMLLYVGGPNRYDAWAYDEGISVMFAGVLTFDDGQVGGRQRNALIAEGFNVQDFQPQLGLWLSFNPVQWIADMLNYNLPVGIGTSGVSPHALTVYAIDTVDQTITVADSDRVQDDYATYNYTWADEVWTITGYPDGQRNIDYVCNFTPYIWQGSGTGEDYSQDGASTDWNNPANWSPSVPASVDMAELFFQHNGVINISGDAFAYRLDINGTRGTVNLQNTGNLNVTANAYVGNSGHGSFNQYGGSCDINGDLFIANSPGTVASYTLFSGTLAGENECIGNYGTGRVYQGGGYNLVNGNLTLGRYPGSSGEYEINAGSELIVSHSEYIGYEGCGEVVQNGGLHQIARELCIGFIPNGAGKYILNSGSLSANSLRIGMLEGQGSLILNGGTVEANRMYLGGSAEQSTLAITDNTAEIDISDYIQIGYNAGISSVAGCKINMNGADFGNRCSNEFDVLGLENIELVFTDVDGNDMYFEVAGEDAGPNIEGFCNNFTLGGITVSPGATLVLKDEIENAGQQYQADANEAFYVKHLDVQDNGILNLNGLNVYTQYFRDLPVGSYYQGIDGIEFNGGSISVVADSDYSADGTVDLKDFSLLAANWLKDCTDPNLCGRLDNNKDHIIDYHELYLLAESWLSRLFDVRSKGYFPTTEPVYSVAVKENLLLAGAGTKLLCLDLSASARPCLLSETVFDDTIYDIEIDGNNAYLAVNQSGLKIIDITNAESPSVIGDFKPAGNVSFLDVDIDGGYAYIADHWNGLRIIDVSDPCVPVQVSAKDVLWYEHGVCSSGDGFVYLTNCSSNGLLTIFDVANPLVPNSVASCVIQPDLPTNNIVYGNGFCYVLSKTGLDIVNVREPSSPSVCKNISIGYGNDIRLASRGNVAFIASRNDGLISVLLSDLENPSKLLSQPLAGSGISLDIGKDCLCVGLLEGGIQVFEKETW